MNLPALEIERFFWERGMINIAGVDEAGRGPLAGPVVAAAVVFPMDQWIEDVDDSKKLTEGKREELFDEIYSKALGVAVSVVDHRTIDRINILQASVLAMQQAVETVSVKPDIVLADGVSFRHGSLRYENIIDGDAKCFSIAAASIVAKVTRDRLMMKYDEEFPMYGFARHKGYATKEHLEAIRALGMCEIHRRSFKPAVLRQPEPDLFEGHF
jgi:ribonuclease HII